MSKSKEGSMASLDVKAAFNQSANFPVSDGVFITEHLDKFLKVSWSICDVRYMTHSLS